jgi:two-component system cell cycle sensor histidine kinase/response regulator CckA
MTMIARVARLLAPPIFEDEEKTRRASLLNVILLAAFVIAALLTLAAPLLSVAQDTTISEITVGVITAALILAMWLIMRRGHVTLASLLLSSTMLVNTTIVVYFIGSIRAPLAANYIVCIVVAGLLVGNHAAVAFLSLSLLALLGLLQAETAGLLPPVQASSGMNNWAVHAAVFGMITVLLILTTRSINEALERTRREERALAEANKGLQREIAERRRAEEEVRKSERRYRLLADNITDIIWTTDLDLRFTYFSPSIVQTGYTVAEAMTLSVEGFLTPASLELARKTLAKELAEEPLDPTELFDSRTLDLGVQRKDGVTLSAESRVNFLRDAEGRPVGILGVTRDTSERKNLEEQLRKAQRLEAIGRLSGGVAHDFNNILTAVTGYSDFLLMDLGPHDPRRDDLEGIKQAAERAATLTQQLLAFGRKQVLQLKVLDLNSVVANMENMLQRLIGEDIDLATALDPSLGRVKADLGRMEQIIMNLVVNARDAMPQGGKLTIKTMNVALDDDYARRHVDVEPGRHVMLAVSDAGIGMDEEIRSHLFEPFFTTKEDGKGTGLGLSTVYGIVKQSNGHISVYSEPERGTTFEIYLPRTDEDADEIPQELASTESPRGSETVLLVEDDDAVRNLVRRILTASDYTVLEAQNGEEAIQICQQHEGQLHLLLTDVVLPGGMSGLQIAERLVPLHPEAKVLYMSGYTDDAIGRHGVLDPDIAFLEKPFAPTTLVHKVRRLLDEA